MAFLAAMGFIPATAQIVLPTDFADETVVSGLDAPNSMAFLPDGRLLFTELYSGKIRMVVNGHIAATDPVGSVDSLVTGGERGLQGIAVDPRWPAFPYVYICYSHVGSRTVLIRFTATGDVANPTGENLFLSSKLTLIHNIQDNSEFHNGLGLRFGTDGMLLMSSGDDQVGCNAQIPGSLNGKLLRLDVSRLPAGGGGPVPRALLIPPSGNAFAGPDSNACLVLALGLRNPWRFHVDPMTGAIILADVGEGMWEEIDQIVPAGNYGWPFREGPALFTPTGCTEPPGSIFNAPIVTVPHPIYLATLTAGFYRPVLAGTSNWPSIYQGSFFYGDFFDSQLRRLVWDGAAWVAALPVAGQPNATDWATGIHYASDFGVGVKDGSLWWLKMMDDAGASTSGSVKRIRYTGTVGVQVPLPTHALRASPNPFQERLDIEWALPGSQPSTLEIFDMAGRRVRREEFGVTQAGRFAWDGRDDRGTSVGAGVYLVRVRTGQHTETVRALRVR